MTSNKTEFCCSDCNKSFECASLLLLHFALHVNQSQYNNINSFLEEFKNENNQDIQNNEVFNSSRSGNVNQKDIPDLYPINIVNKNKIGKTNDTIKNENLQTNPKCLTSQKSSEDDFCPLKFCSVSMEEKSKSTKNEKNFKKKKYSCNICSKVFGWSTDLKRHLLTHSGERPFKCTVCNACFTRNFVLQKHIAKAHDCKNTKNIMPKLKPITKKENMINKIENFNQVNLINMVDNSTLVQ